MYKMLQIAQDKHLLNFLDADKRSNFTSTLYCVKMCPKRFWTVKVLWNFSKSCWQLHHLVSIVHCHCSSSWSRDVDPSCSLSPHQDIASKLLQCMMNKKRFPVLQNILVSSILEWNENNLTCSLFYTFDHSRRVRTSSRHEWVWSVKVSLSVLSTL